MSSRKPSALFGTRQSCTDRGAVGVVQTFVERQSKQVHRAQAVIDRAIEQKAVGGRGATQTRGSPVQGSERITTTRGVPSGRTRNLERLRQVGGEGFGFDCQDWISGWTRGHTVRVQKGSQSKSSMMSSLIDAAEAQRRRKPCEWSHGLRGVRVG